MRSRQGFPDSDFPADGVQTIALAALWARETYGLREAVVAGERRMTFDDYVAAALAIAKALIGSGLDVGDRVAIWAPNSIEFAIAALGVHCAGAALVPINTRFKRAELENVVRQARVKVAFTVEGFLGRSYADELDAIDAPGTDGPAIVCLEATGPRCLNAFVAQGAAISDTDLHLRMARVAPGDIGTILFTSGTTGQPKGAMLRHGALVRAYWTFSGAAGLREGDRYLCTNPMFHAFGLKAGLLSALLRGAAIYPLAVYNPQHVLEVIERERITYYPGPPTVFEGLLGCPDLARRDIDSLRGSVIGATTLPPSVIRAMYDRLGFEEVHVPYGFTEATGVATITRASDSRELVETTAGVALPGITVRVIRADGTEAAAGEIGEIVVDGYNRMAGYLDPDKRQPITDDGGPLHSGDLGEIDEHGYLTVRGRIKDMYIVGGFNVYPAEVEAVIREMPEIAEVAVVGMPDSRLGEVGCAFVVTRPGATAGDNDVIGWCRERVANFKVPRAVRFLPSLPLNATGKVAKPTLRAMLPTPREPA